MAVVVWNSFVRSFVALCSSSPFTYYYYYFAPS